MQVSGLERKIRVFRAWVLRAPGITNTLLDAQLGWILLQGMSVLFYWKLC